MKLHLPLSLRSALLAACALVTGFSSYAVAETMTQDVVLTDADAVQNSYEYNNGIRYGWNGVGGGYPVNNYKQYWLNKGWYHWFKDENILVAGGEWRFVRPNMSYDGNDRKYSYKVSVEQAGTAWFLGGGSVTYKNMDEISIKGTSAANSDGGRPWIFEVLKKSENSVASNHWEQMYNILHVNVSDSNSFSFIENHACDVDGSVTTSGSFHITNVDKVEFRENQGSLFTDCADGKVTFKECAEIVFDGNRAKEGVIANASSLVGIDDPMPEVKFEDCTSVTISNNTAIEGWLFASALPVFKNIDTVKITGNTTQGGVLLARNISLSDIRKGIYINDNSATYQSGNEYYWDGFSFTYQKGFITYGSMDTHSADPAGIVANGDASTMSTVFEMNGNKGFGDFSCITPGTMKLSYFDRVDINGNELSSTIGNTGGLVRYLQFDHINEVNIKDNRIRSIDDQKYGEYGVAGVEKDFYITADKVTISGNSNIATTAAHGGAMCIAMFGDTSKQEYSDSFTFTGIKELKIENNWAQGAYLEEDEYAYDSEKTLGGAIYVDCMTSDSGNFPTGKIEFVNNDHVVMRGNYITDGKKYILNAISTSNAPLILKAGAGQTIECYDGLIINTPTAKIPYGLEINGDIADQDGPYNGTVVFSAKYAEADLKKINPNYTQEELLASSSIAANRINVYNGTLKLDNARLDMTTGGYYASTLDEQYFVSRKEALVEMIDSVIHTEMNGYSYFIEGLTAGGRVTLPTASFTGHNTIEAAQIFAQESTWTFNVGAVNKNEAVLHIGYDGGIVYGAVYKFDRGIQTTNQTFHINVEAGLAKGLYKLLDYDQGDENAAQFIWYAQDTITLTGAASGKIGKDGGSDVYYTISGNIYTLWFDYEGTSTPPPSTPAQRDATTLTWTAPSGTWNNGVGAEAGTWSGTVEDLNFYTGDKVVFGQAAAVTVAGVVRPAEVLVSNAEGQVVLTGINDGQITGGGGITKEGAGELVLNLANAYTGATTIKAGKLTVGNANAFGQSAVQLQGGELNLGGLAVSNVVNVTGTAAITGGSKYAGALKLAGGSLTGEAINLTREAELVKGSVANDLIGSGAAVKSGADTTVTLSGNIANAGGVAVNEGTLALEGATVSSSLTVNDGGTLSMTDSSLKGSLTLQAGSTAKVDELEVVEGAELTTEAAQSITGNVTLAGGTLTLGDTLTVEGKLSSTSETEVKVNNSKLVEEKELIVMKATDMSGTDQADIRFTELEKTRAEVGFNEEKTELWVKLDNQTLVWTPGTTSWGVKDDGEWETGEGVEDKRFYNLDNVVFEDAGTVNITGEVEPGLISVKGEGDTVFTGDGHIVGEANLEKEGKGKLTIDTDNSGYKGTMWIFDGTLEVTKDNGLGSSVVCVDNANFVGGGHAGSVSKLIFTGEKNRISGADNVSSIEFRNAKVDGDYRLAQGNRLSILPNIVGDKGRREQTATPGSSTFTGNFIFDGGTLELSGKLDLTGTTQFESRSTIDLTNWEGEFVEGETYELLFINGLKETDAEKWFDLIGLDDMDGLTVLEFENESLWLTIRQPQADPTIMALLTRNQRAAYYALEEIKEDAGANEELKTVAGEVLRTKDAAAAAALLDSLDGAELATMMQSQIEGNLAHLRRLRANMGSGQRIATGSSSAAYMVAYDELSRVRGDASGLGIHRSEWGGMVGYESACNDSTLLGVALNAGWARVNPSSAAPRYHEEAKRLDVYAEKSFGKGWQSVTSVGAGIHDFRLRRTLPNGAMSKTGDVDGWSINFSEEISYTKRICEHCSFQPFFAVESSVNHIGSFTESGAGSLSLGGRARNAWATDLTLGARFTRFFNAAGGRGSLTMQAGLVASVGDTTSDLNLHFVGAPGVSYTVSTANRNRWGYNVGANVSVPVTKQTSITAGVNAVLRGDSKEANASVGLRKEF